MIDEAPKTPVDDPVIRKPEIMRQLGYRSTRTIDRLFADGELPVVEIGPRCSGALQSDVTAFKLGRRRVRAPAAATAAAARDQV